MPRKLLTKNQLIDWLIYHCPLFDTGEVTDPFIISYQGQLWRCDFQTIGSEPLEMYNELALSIIQTSRRIHQEITDLYWYWTI